MIHSPPKVLISNGDPEHVAHTGRKISLSGEKKKKNWPVAALDLTKQIKQNK